VTAFFISVVPVKPTCCWHQEHIDASQCPYINENDRELLYNRQKRFLLRCVECPRFMDDLDEMGRTEGGLAELFPAVCAELLQRRADARDLERQLANRSRESRFVSEVSQVIQTSLDKDEVITMALTAVTAGKGFGLNRAILLLVDKERQNLVGYLAVGPRQREEAWRVWNELAAKDYSLREMAQVLLEQKLPEEKAKFRELLEILSVPLSRSDHLFIRTLNDRRSRHIPDLQREPHMDPDQVAALEVNELVMIPLVSTDRRVGLLLADNIINNRPISEEDLQSMAPFATAITFALTRAALYERLQQELRNLTEANVRLKEQQELILRMEKMALVGKITANVAHSIRNPLTIIGGFARSLLRSTHEHDANRAYIESIVREAKRLEEVLQEVLNYSESLHPTFDQWDINQLVTGVYTGMRDELRSCNVECQLDFAPDLPQVTLDYKKITYCLRSLIHNALEAMPAGGKLEIRTGRSNDEVLLTLSDTGLGMDAEQIKAVTTPFFSTKEQGSGLGLSLCARILEGHNAVLEIASAKGAGTTFCIRFMTRREET